nr:AsmA family protein [Roseospira navarrensis]
MLLILGILLVVALGAALVAPSFIDWNPWRERIADRIAAATGRPVGIDGDLSFRILPAPTLSVEGVRLGNVPGGSTRDMARIGALKVAVDLAPLLSGEIRVRSIRVIDPVVLFERLQDGRANWTFGGPGNGAAIADPAVPGSSGAGSGEDGAAPGLSGGGLTVRLDSVRIENGLAVFKNQASGAEFRAEAIRMDLSAESLRGPVRLSGDAEVAATPVAFDILAGTVSPGRDTSLQANLLLPDTAATLELSGSVAGLGGSRPTFSGEGLAAGDSLTATLAALGGGDALPPRVAALAGRPFSVEGALTLAVGSGGPEGTLSDLQVALGEAEARGTLSVALEGTGGGPAIDAHIRLRALDVDAWLAAAPDPAPETAEPDAAPSLETTQPPEAPTDEPASPPAGTAFALPPALSARVNLTADALTWRGEVVRQISLDARLTDGVLTVAEAGAALPGASRVGMDGTLTARDGRPTVSATVSATAGNLREVLAWLRVPVQDVPDDRLRAFSLSTQVEGDPAALRLNDLDLTLDTTRATGALALRPGDRLGLGVNLSVDTLNLDAYRPATQPAAAAEPAEPAETAEADPAADGAPAETAPAQSAAQALEAAFAPLAPLNDVDANIRLSFGTLTVDALPLTGVRAEGSLVDGRLTLATFEIERVAAARVTARGSLSGFGGTPRADALTVTVAADDPTRSARLLRTELPPALRDLGAITQSVTLTGTPQAVDITTATRTPDGGLDTNGRIEDPLGAAPTYDLAIDLRHPEAVRLVRLFAPAYAPAGAPLGPVALTTQARGDLDTVTLDGLDLRVGDTRVTGQARVTLSGGRPHVAAGLSTTRLPIDAFLPPRREARRPETPAPGAARVIPAAFVGRAAVPAPSADAAARPVAWSTAPIDLSALTLLDADIALRSTALVYAGTALDNADITARLADGVLRVERLTGQLYGGDASGTLTVVAGSPASYDLDLEVSGFDVGRLPGLDGAVGSAGTGRLVLDLAGAGTSMADLVRAVTGDGTLSLADLDVRAGQVRGTALAGVLEPIGALNDLAGSVLGDLDRAQRLADLDGRFTIDDGRLAFDPLRLVSALYEGEFSGVVDLIGWTVDASGVADLSDSPLQNALGRVIRLPDTLPIAVRGDLDAPTVTLQTGRLRLDRDTLEDEAGRLLRGLLPEGGDEPGGDEPAEAPPTDTQAAPAPAEPPPAAPTPDQIIDDLLRGLIPRE